MDLIALSIPIFFILMGVEWGLSKWRGEEVYRFADSVANLGCGIIQQTSKAFMTLLTAVGYVVLYENYRVFSPSSNEWWVWVLCFLGVDFCYYWFHRMSHECNLLWAAHVVHHQSEEYNLGVALRQSAFQGLFSWIFYLPLAVIGFSPWLVGIIRILNALYQFWIHTQLINHLGPLEWIFNTPSHHRVHHGQNPQYIDRNHAGTLIIWDKMFGTFAKEDEKVIYGITEPPNSWNPVFANFHHIKLSWSRMASSRRWSDKLKVWWTQPGYIPEGVSHAGKRTNSQEKYITMVTKPTWIYVLIQFSILLFTTITYLWYQKVLAPTVFVIWATAIIFTAGSLGAFLDHQRWSLWAETIRLPLITLMAVCLFPGILLKPLPLFALTTLGLLSLYILRWAEISAKPDVSRFSGKNLG
ncbi:MAG: sterol desaturase family protein [Myxococcales bacterium]|nr:sterol desaturase family protein [Myxococcales bacterium]